MMYSRSVQCGIIHNVVYW